MKTAGVEEKTVLVSIASISCLRTVNLHGHLLVLYYTPLEYKFFKL